MRGWLSTSRPMCRGDAWVRAASVLRCSRRPAVPMAGSSAHLTRGPLKLFLRVLLDVFDRVLDGPDLLRVFVGDVDLESLFECKDEFDQTEGVGAEVVDERRLWLDVLLVDVELLFDDALDLARNVLGHTCASHEWNREPV